MKHTQAPWAYHRHKQQDVKQTGFIILEDKTIGAKNIGIVISDILMMNEEVEANAKLMTAAPLLLKALQHLVSLKDYKDVHNKDDYYEEAQPLAWQNARLALTIATGKGNDELSEYFDFRNIPDRGLCALVRQMFTVGLVVGMDEEGYQGRYCYPDLRSAKDAIQEWDGAGDPPGPWIKYKGEGGERGNPNKEINQ